MLPCPRTVHLPMMMLVRAWLCWADCFKDPAADVEEVEAVGGGAGSAEVEPADIDDRGVVPEVG